MTVDYAYDYSDLTTVNTIYQPVTPPCGGDPSTCNKGQTDQIKESTSSRTSYSDKREDELASSSPMQDSTTEIEGHSLTFAMDFDTWQMKYIAAYRTLDDESYADLTGDGDPDFRLDSNVYCGPAAQVAVGGCTPLVVPKSARIKPLTSCSSPVILPMAVLSTSWVPTTSKKTRRKITLPCTTS